MKYILFSVLLQASFKSDVNDILDKYALPAAGLCILLGVVGGLMKNWDAINDNSGAGRRKEGLLNVLYIIGYVVLIVAIIAGAITLIGKINLKI